MENENIIIIAGVEFDEERFPHLYRFAQTNPEGLEQTLEDIVVASGGSNDDYQSVAINMENDLAHG